MTDTPGTDTLTTAQLMTIPLAAACTERLYVPDLDGEVVIGAFSVTTYRRMIEESTGENDEYDPNEFEIRVLAEGLKDPVLTLEQVRKLHGEHKMGPIRQIIEAIYKLTGLTRFGGLSEEAVGKAERKFRD